MHSFDAHLPEMPTAEELAKNNKSFGIEQVVKYAEQTGAISGRLQWFECYAGASPFYQKVAKPLLSMGTVGSMDCERRAKPLKHTIVTSKRNRLKDETGVALLRGYENLNHLMNAKKLVGKQVHESLLRR